MPDNRRRRESHRKFFCRPDELAVEQRRVVDRDDPVECMKRRRGEKPDTNDREMRALPRFVEARGADGGAARGELNPERLLGGEVLEMRARTVDLLARERDERRQHPGKCASCPFNKDTVAASRENEVRD